MENRAAETISKMVEKMGVDVKKYQIDKGYPEVYVTEKDKKYLNLILDDYAGGVSEFTAISQYIFAHTMAENEKSMYNLDEIAEAFVGIAIIEMFHLEFLADVIIKLGGEPKIYNGRKKYWRGDLVPYGKNTRDRLLLAIKAETDAINQYEKHIELIDNNSIDMLLSRIVEDETLHREIFEKLLRQLK